MYIFNSSAFLKFLFLFACFTIGRAKDFYSYSAKDIFGDEVDFETFRDKTVLIVNVPNECRFANSEYNDLQSLSNNLAGMGTFKILAFQSDDFGGLHGSPCTPSDLKQLIKKKKKNKSDFDDIKLFKLTNVIGADAHPLFKYLRRESSIKPDGYFYKYLVDIDGKVSEVFPPTVSVINEAFTTIESYVSLSLNIAEKNMEKLMKEAKKLEKELGPDMNKWADHMDEDLEKKANKLEKKLGPDMNKWVDHLEKELKD